MKICFELQLDEIPIFIEMAKILDKDAGIRISGVSLGKRYQNEIKKAPIINFNISEFLRRSFKKDISSKEIDGYNQKYQELGLDRILYIDRLLAKKRYAALLHWAIGHLRFYEHYFQTEQPDFFVSSPVTYMTQLAAYLVAKKRGIPYLGMATTRIPNERFIICRNLDDAWNTVNKAYSDLNKALKPPTELAKTFIRQFREQPIQPRYMNTIWQRYFIQKSHIAEFFKRANSFYFKGWGWGRNRFDYYTYSPFYYASRELSKMIKISLYRRARIFKKPKDGERFILFPLHLEPEASTTVQSRFFIDQISTVENIAKCLPLGCILYAKEHLSAFGRRKNEFYRKISNIPNLKLVHPEENRIDLMKKSEMIVTISSTLGWEALLLKKPVIVLGNVFYNHSGLVTKVNNYGELETSILRILADKDSMTGSTESEERLGRFLDAIFEGSYEGHFDLPIYNPHVMKHENIRLLVKGLMRDIER